MRSVTLFSRLLKGEIGTQKAAIMKESMAKMTVKLLTLRWGQTCILCRGTDMKTKSTLTESSDKW